MAQTLFKLEFLDPYTNEPEVICPVAKSDLLTQWQKRVNEALNVVV